MAIITVAHTGTVTETQNNWKMSAKSVIVKKADKSKVLVLYRAVSSPYRWTMGVSLLEHRRNEEILEEARVVPIAMAMRRRRLEWFGHVKRRNETENIRAVAEMKMEGKRHKGRPKLRWKYTVRGYMTTWNIREERQRKMTEKDGKVSTRPATRTGRRRGPGDDICAFHGQEVMEVCKLHPENKHDWKKTGGFPR